MEEATLTLSNTPSYDVSNIVIESLQGTLSHLCEKFSWKPLLPTSLKCQPLKSCPITSISSSLQAPTIYGIPLTVSVPLVNRRSPPSESLFPIRRCHKTYQIRLQPTTAQKEQLEKTFGCTRYVYNHFLARRKSLWQDEEKTLSYSACSKELTQLKKEESTQWLREVDKFALQNALRDLENAYSHFFKRVKKGKRGGYPHLRSRKKEQSYRTNVTNGNLEVRGGYLKLPKLGKVKFRQSQELEGKIVSVTVKKTRSGKYLASVVCEVEETSWEKTGKGVGLDWGLLSYLTTSDGEKVENPRYWKKYLKKLKKAHQELSRKVKGSTNWEKARIKLSQVYESLANVRKDSLHKLSRSLVERYDMICLETLRISNLVRNKRLSKSILDGAWGLFVEMLKYKGERYGKEVVKVSAFFPSSQRCHVCHEINPEVKDLLVREWECKGCGCVHDRDINAALNLLEEGLKLLSVAVGMPDTLTACGDGVRLGVSWATVCESGITRLRDA